LHYRQWKKRPYFTTHGLFIGILETESVQKEARKCSPIQGPQVKLGRARSEDLCRKAVTNARVSLLEVVNLNSGQIEHVLH
jgi:RNase P/RNase MRP subunit p30